jgi:predicted ATPase/class 3 adenylate cyclase
VVAGIFEVAFLYISYDQIAYIVMVYLEACEIVNRVIDFTFTLVTKYPCFYLSSKIMTDQVRQLAAIMFTDIAGYTEMMQKDEENARHKIKRHREVIEEQHAKYEGRIINFFGDGTLSIFSSSVKAVECAIEIQKQLKTPIEVPLRIGIDVGDIIIENSNILGDAVNLASRIESFSVPGSVLISEALHNQIKNQSKFQFQLLGKFNFKNVEKAKDIYALTCAGLIVPDPSDLKGKGQFCTSVRDNFPTSLTSFLGRTKEISEIKELLQDNKLIILTGPGGTGKTRLSIQVARELKNNFPGGIFWVPLTPLNDAKALALAITDELNLEEDPTLSAIETLIQFFKDKHALLVLDNFEHIVEASLTVQNLLCACGSLSVMVTSRIVLQIPGEIEYKVPPLNIPNPNESHTIEHLKDITSIALFTERARASRPNFQLTEENAETVAEICVHLDGLPLGIELAAARTKIFSPKALLERLSKSLDILKGGGQFPARHQTMRQTIAWSYDLLDPEEQKLFRRISLFTGGSTMEAIETICGENGLADYDVIDGVMALVDKSLLRTYETDDDLRFYMLSTIKEFGIDELKKTEEEQSAKTSHINYYLHLSEEAAPHFYGTEAKRWRSIIHQEQSNIRTAIDYAIELNEMAFAYRLGHALIPYWNFSGSIASEGVQQLEKLIAVQVPDSLISERYKILQALAFYYCYTPYLDKARPIFEECLAYWRKDGDKFQIGHTLNSFGFHHIEQGFYKKSEELSLEAKAIFEELSNKDRIVASLQNLGMGLAWRNRPLEAIPYFKETLQLTEQIGDKRRNAQALLFIGYSNYLMGRYKTAEDHIQNALVYFREFSSRLFEEVALIFLCYIQYEYGDFKKCEELSYEIEKIARETSTLFALACAYECRVMAVLGMGNLSETESLIDKTMRVLDITNSKIWINRLVHHKTMLAWEQGDVELLKSCTAQLVRDELEEEDYMGFVPGLEFAAWIAARYGDYKSAGQLYSGAQSLRQELGLPQKRNEIKICQDFLKKMESKLSDNDSVAAQDVRFDNQQLLDLALSVTDQNK